MATDNVQPGPAQYVCLPLTGSQVCTNWAGSSQNPSPTAYVNVSSLWNIATFDTDMKIWADSPQHTSDFNAAYGCSWKGDGLRYVLTYGCAERIFASDRSCNLGLMNSTSTLKPICRSTCLTYLSTVQSLLSNEGVCPTTLGALVANGQTTLTQEMLDERDRTLRYVSKFCDVLSVQDDANSNVTTPTNCISAVDMDYNSCGYSTRANPSAFNYCSNFPTTSQPSCCSRLSAKPSPPPSTGLSPGAIAGIVLGSLAAVALLVGGVYLVIRKRKATTIPPSPSKSQNGSMGTSSSTAFSRSARKRVNRDSIQSISQLTNYSPYPDHGGSTLAQQITFIPDPQGNGVTVRSGPAYYNPRDSQDYDTDDDIELKRMEDLDNPFNVYHASGPRYPERSSSYTLDQSSTLSRTTSLPARPPTMSHMSVKSGRTEDSIASGASFLPPASVSSLGLRHIAIHPYTPQLSDELGLVRGDVVYVKEVFSDNWSKGINWSKDGAAIISTLGSDWRNLLTSDAAIRMMEGSWGVFPTACIVPLSKNGPGEGDDVVSKYVFGE